MSLAAVVSPYQPINGLTGLGLNNGFLYIGIDGQDPETNPQACFWDAAGTIPATQPVSILGGYPMRLGTPTRLYTGSTYSIRVRDASLAQVFYEAHAVPSASTAGGIFATIADATAASIPTSAHLTGVQTLGYYAALDSGGAYYKYSASMPAHPGRFQSADGAWWELQPALLGVNLRALGAKGDGAADDSTALANTILVARVLPILAVYAPAGTYKITTSQDFTYSTAGSHLLTLVGDGSGKTIFDISAFAEAYPAIDFTGNGQGVLRGVTIRSTSSGCLATTCFLGAKNAVNYSGNAQLLDDVHCEFPRSGYNANNYAGVVIASIDRTIIRNSYFYGPRAAHISGYRPAAVSSKFQSHSTQVDWTECELQSVVCVGSSGPALTTSGALKMSGAMYTALENSGGTNSDCIVSVTTGGVVDSSGHDLQGFLRTENQSGSAGVSCIKLDTPCRGWNLWGQLETDVAGYIFGGTSTLGSSLLVIDSGTALGLFKSGVGVCSMLDIVTSSIGAPGTPGAGSANWRVSGAGMQASALVTAGVSRVEVRRNDGTWRRSSDQIVLAPVSSALLRPTGFHNRFTGNTAYVAPAEQLVKTFVIPAGLASNDGLIGGVLGAGYRFIMDWEKTGGALINGRLRVELAQGGNVVDIFDTGATLAAGSATGQLEARVFSLSGTVGTRAKVIAWSGSLLLGQKFTNTQGFGIVGNLDINVNIYWTNGADATFQVDQIEGRWL